MGTKVGFKSYLSGYNYSTKDMNQDSNSTGWPLFYTEKTIQNGQHYNGLIPRSLNDKFDKNALKQKMLEHEAIFKNQVYELHRVYRIQKEMMEELKQKELHKRHISIDTSSSTSFLQLPNTGCSSSRPYALGADVITSPLSCNKGHKTTQAGLIPPQNGWSSKDCEILESRPSKVRKKLFDLELPADEYIDTEEEEEEEEEERGEFLENKISDTTLKKDSIGFADLNAPYGIISASVGPRSVDFLEISCHNGETRGHGNGARSKLPYLGLPAEFLPNFPRGSSYRCIEDKKGNDRGWMLNITEPGTSKSNLNCMPRSFQSENKLPIPSHPNGFLFSNVHQQHHNRVIGMSDKSQSQSKYNHQEPVMASCMSGSYPFLNSTDPLSKSWSHSVSSWGNPLTSVQTNPSVCWNRNPQLLDQTHGDRWHVNGTSTSNPVFTSEPATSNRFYHGFPSRSNEMSVYFPSRSFDFPNCHKVTNFWDSKSTKDMNPNLITKISSSEAVHCKNIEIVDKKEKYGDRIASLPWLRAKPVCKNEGSGTRSDPISVDLGFTKSSSSNILYKSETKNDSLSLISPSEGKNLQVESKHRLIDINVACDDTVLEENIRNDESAINLVNGFDLNSCVSDDEDALEPCDSKENPNRRMVVEIDLEAPVVQESEESTIAEEEQNVIEQSEEEFIRTAAESIVSMSASSQHQHIELEASIGQPLIWFVDIVSSCVVDVDRTSDKESRDEESACVEIDYYEVMTLQLKETKEEEYMPEAFVVETQDPEEENRAGRSRRNQSRRGRQRRDFQRDILPGLTSLARHEVTEDLQTFGGLMRATGHTNWQTGMARRNGSGAGRRRRRQVVVEVVQPPEPPVVCKTLMERLQSIEVGLEDKSLTGWGKTTRRPRRQRCPAAGNTNTLAIALT